MLRDCQMRARITYEWVRLLVHVVHAAQRGRLTVFTMTHATTSTTVIQMVGDGRRARASNLYSRTRVCMWHRQLGTDRNDDDDDKRRQTTTDDYRTDAHLLLVLLLPVKTNLIVACSRACPSGYKLISVRSSGGGARHRLYLCMRFVSGKYVRRCLFTFYSGGSHILGHFRTLSCNLRAVQNFAELLGSIER